MDPSLTEIWPYNGGDRGSGEFASGFIEQLLNNNGVSNQMQVKNGGPLEESTFSDQSRSFGGNVNELKNSNGKRMKTSGSGEENGNSKADIVSAKPGKKEAEPLKDYIHVRSRRGEATDSHSLAERARREKIGERMKVLQDLVPGTNKVIGKALVLDEIINYVQSLQRQVERKCLNLKVKMEALWSLEFLSMKLETVNSGMIHTISGFHSKDINQLGMPSFHPSEMMFGSQATRELETAAAVGGPQLEWLHMQLGGSFGRTS
ncbi:hypothetical protein KSS87_021891 [Heliosperma pusillum]|nr:hypothetical protein KSS87_021891 [Heliosperma pusillum]